MWQTSSQAFQIPPTLFLSGSHPTKATKQEIADAVRAEFPGSYICFAGNTERGIAWSDKKMFRQVIQNIIKEKVRTATPFHLLLLVDSASIHMVNTDLTHPIMRSMAQNLIYFVVTEGGITDIIQPCDADGLFRHLKSSIRNSLGPFLKNREGGVVATRVFWRFLKETLTRKRFSGIRPFRRCGLSPAASHFRANPTDPTARIQYGSILSGVFLEHANDPHTQYARRGGQWIKVTQPRSGS